MSVCSYVLNWLRNYERRNDTFSTNWLFANMPFTKEDKILIKNLFELKGYNARHLVKRVSQRKLKCQQHLQIVEIAMGYWLVDRRLGNGRWRSARIDLVDELVLHKNCQSRNSNKLHNVLNNMTLLFTKYYQNWSMSVEDMASRSSVIFAQDWKYPFSEFIIPKVVQRH